MKKLLALLVAAAALGACNDAAGAFHFNSEVTREEESGTGGTADASNQGANGVRVVGATLSPCWWDRVRLDGDRSGNTLTVRVIRVAQEPCTDNRVRRHTWIGIFSGLSSGTYTVRVIDEVDGTPETIHEESFPVPRATQD